MLTCAPQHACASQRIHEQLCSLLSHPELVQTWSGKADALIQLGQALTECSEADVDRAALAATLAKPPGWKPPMQQAARAAIEAGHEAYIEATSWSSSDNGDDLPGLFCNWASGLLAAGELEMAAGEEAAAERLLTEASACLRTSLEFNRGDVQVCSGRPNRGLVFPSRVQDPSV